MKEQQELGTPHSQVVSSCSRRRGNGPILLCGVEK